MDMRLRTNLSRLRSHMMTMCAAVSLLLAACSPARDVLTLPTEPPSTVSLGTPFTLAPGASVLIESRGLTLTFVGVTGDSRCPTNALIQCVWGGSAIVQLRVTDADGTRTVSLETLASRDTAKVDGFMVWLVEVTPVPTTTDPIPPASYRATLRMTAR